MKKILHFSCYYKPHIGGIEQVAEDVVKALSSEPEYEQRVLCFHDKRNTQCDTVDGIPITRAGCFAKVASQQLSLHFNKLLKRQMKEFRPDILIFHYPNPFAAHYVLKALKKYPFCKLILYWHLDITKQKLLGKLFAKQSERLLKKAVKIVATSPNYIEGSKFLSAYRKKCVVIPNCVCEERLALSEEDRARAELLREQYPGKTLCFAVGRHVPYKGMEYLVRASKLLDDRFRIFIGGTGELTNSLKKLAEGDSKLTFLGRMSEEDLKAYMLASDIFCFPSVYKNEAFGIALAEAMSCGKPSVTFTIKGSGVNYVSLSGVTGIEVENANVEEYARAIVRLQEDEALRIEYGKAAYEREQALFTEAEFKKNILNLLQSIEL